jgi:hypothetical protein
MSVFRAAFERWVSGADGQDLPATMDDAMAELRAVTAGN